MIARTESEPHKSPTTENTSQERRTRVLPSENQLTHGKHATPAGQEDDEFLCRVRHALAGGNHNLLGARSTGSVLASNHQLCDGARASWRGLRSRLPSANHVQVTQHVGPPALGPGQLPVETEMCQSDNDPMGATRAGEAWHLIDGRSRQAHGNSPVRTRNRTRGPRAAHSPCYVPIVVFRSPVQRVGDC